MSRACSDTGERSLAHWSEAGREEMDAFYRVATLDYRELVRAFDWDACLGDRIARRSPVRILDVACGSGKFPAALRAHTGLGALEGCPLVLDLLDPSPFSLTEARDALAPPMRAGRAFECTLQALPQEACGYDVVWAVHALYAVPEAELAAGARAFLRALAPDGLGFVAHATRAAHYIAFYEAYLESFDPHGTPFSSAESVAEALRDAGAEVDVRTIAYEQVIDDERVLEGFLQRCVFDDALGLADMRRDGVLGPYLERRRDGGGRTRLQQEVAMMFIRR